MRAKPLLLLVAAMVAGGVYIVWSRHHGAKPAMAGAAAVPVLAAAVEQRVMPVRLPAVGTVTAEASVAVKSRIDGQIVKVGFTEGQDVEAGQMLFVIDPRALRAQLHQAEANLARDQALFDTTRADVARYSDLVKQNLLPRQELEKARATLGQVEASIRADKAAVEMYRVQLSYTAIRSPIDGRAGALLLDLGNMVKANDTSPLVVINQLKPIDITFAVPERQLPAVRRAMAAGPVTVSAVVADDSAHPVSGELYFIDNSADPATATVQLKARFANAELALWPGQFVQVTLLLGSEGRAIVIPAEAVQEGQRGSYVYVIKADHSVELRPVRVERIDSGLAVIAEGLQAGEQVVTDGQLRLVPGAKVVLRQSASEAQGGGGAPVQ